MCVSFLLAWATQAEARTVALVHARNVSAARIETVTRLHGELLAVGLDVRLVRLPSGAHDATASGDWPSQFELDGTIDAVLQIIDARCQVDVWVLDRSSGKVHLTRVDVAPDTENASEKLSIRAIEVLRSAFLEHDLSRQQDNEPAAMDIPSSTASDGASTAPSTAHSPLGVAAGVATLTSLDGVGPAIMPLARFDVSLHPSIALQVALAGLGSRPVVESGTDSALVSQTYAVLGVRYKLQSSELLQPFVGVAAGALSTTVSGQAEPPGRARERTPWSLLVEAGMGADLQVLDRYYVSLAAHVHLSQPSIAIHILDSEVATSGRPNLALTLAFGAWL